MKKTSLNFGEFRQYDKVFLTADNGIDCENVSSVAFDGETLYIAQPDGVFEYADGKMKKTAIAASKIFSADGKLYAAIGNSLAEIKKGKAKNIAEFDTPVKDISVALDGSFWLITDTNLYLKKMTDLKQLFLFPNQQDALLLSITNQSTVKLFTSAQALKVSCQ